MALSYGLSLNMSLVFSIQNQCTIANYIISVERLKQYMHVPSEAPEIIEKNRPPVNWPCWGRVEIQDLQVKFIHFCSYLASIQGISIVMSDMENRSGTGKTPRLFYVGSVVPLKEGTRLVL